MKKAVFLLMLTTLVTGCQLTGPRTDQENHWASIRCWALRDQSPLTKEHLEYIRDRSENGDALCKMILGDMHERGLGMPKDVAKAKAIYQAVADVDKKAYFHLGRMAEEGIGEPVDYVKARQLYERASAKTALAKLMEEGKGGPQDLDGALALYLNSIELYGDDAWVGVRRLRAAGLTLNAEQEKQYNGMWAKGLRNTLNRKIGFTRRELLKEIKPGSLVKPIRPAKLQLEFPLESDVPKVSLLESSGDPAIDQAVLKAMSTFKFPDAPIQPGDQKSWKVVFNYSLRDT